MLTTTTGNLLSLGRSDPLAQSEYVANRRSEQQVRREVAEILARGVVRLLIRRRQEPLGRELSEKLPTSGLSCSQKDRSL